MTDLPALTLVIGGASSGKSDYAEELVRADGRPRIYVATGQAFDAEMEAKIEAHRTSRADDGWTTLEEPLDLVGILSALPPGSVALVDCATFWLSNQMMEGTDIDAEMANLIDAFSNLPAPIVVVSNEVGHGIVPENGLARQFRQAHGMLNRKIAEQAELVLQVTVGIPRALKGKPPTAAT